MLANEKQLKNLCRKICKDSNTADDLFQMAYEAMVNLPDHRVINNEKYMRCLYYGVVRQLWFNRNRKGSELRMVITEFEVPEMPSNESYFSGIEDFIERKSYEPGWYLPMQVFKLICIEGWGLIELSKKTGINHAYLAEHKKRGQLELQKLFK